MKSSLSPRITVAAMSAFVVLVLFGTVASACEDDPTFLFKDKKNKTCTWVSGAKQMERLCKRRKISIACPVTCKACRTVCPKKKRNMINLYKKSKKCHNYEAGIKCSYGSEIYECNESRNWIYYVDPPVTIDPIEICPAVIEMKEIFATGASCGGYQVGLKCRYESTPDQWYECMDSNEWVIFVDPPIHVDPPVTIDPIEICPTEREMKEIFDNGESCGGYQVGLKCSYKSTPDQWYECMGSNKWVVFVDHPIHVDPPVTILPIEICPTEKEMKELYDNEGSCGGYQPGLTCRYKSAPNMWYECDQGTGQWILGVSDPRPPIEPEDPIVIPEDPDKIPPKPIFIGCPETFEGMEALYNRDQTCDNFKPGLRCHYESDPNMWYECDQGTGQWILGVSDPDPVIPEDPDKIFPKPIFLGCPETFGGMQELYNRNQKCDNFKPDLECKYTNNLGEWFVCDGFTKEWTRVIGQYDLRPLDKFEVDAP